MIGILKLIVVVACSLTATATFAQPEVKTDLETDRENLEHVTGPEMLYPSVNVLPGFYEPNWTEPTPEQHKVRELVVASKAKIYIMNWGYPSFYDRTDRIYMTKLERFREPDMFYWILLHELAHWTGNQGRLDRFFFVATSKQKKKLYGADSKARTIHRLQEETTADLVARHFAREFDLASESVAERRIELRFQHYYDKLGPEALDPDRKNKILARAQADADKAIQYLQQFRPDAELQ